MSRQGNGWINNILTIVSHTDKVTGTFHVSQIRMIVLK